ncbi:MAG TPA: nucleoside deaminase [Acetobacteraceae bacterium]|jgi:tRNA(Arg) A34 adenosine deaminase TadA|nr:nucleoside deaminase [Acetobacteraceae bacterium]
MPGDEEFMRQAIALSRRNLAAGTGGPFGAVVVMDGQVVGEGANQVTSTNDPTAHAEVVAIREACRRLGRFDLRGATIYTSCEPCPMCLAAIHWARLDAVHYANDRHDAAAIGFDDELLYREIPKPVEARALPMRRLLAAEALEVFSEWAAKPDKVPY